MAFHEVRFPEDISYGAVGGPKFKTTIFEADSGYEQRNIDWSQMRAEYVVGQNINTQPELDALFAFFYARRGRAHGFRFKDFTDFEISGPQSIGTGDGATTVFQVFKRYSSGGENYDRTIKKLVSGTVSVYKDAVLQASGFTVDLNAGTVTFSVAPAMGVVIGVEAEFDVPVRFDVDHMQVSIESFAERDWSGIRLVEVRL